MGDSCHEITILLGLSFISVLLITGRPVCAADPPEAASSERGKQIFSVNCAFCHGSSAQGGEGGPNLLNSPYVVNDQNGEILTVLVQSGRPDKGMPKFDLPAGTIAEIAAYLHSKLLENDPDVLDAKTVLVGNAAAGKAFFYGKGRCSQCHSVKGDLAGIGSKFGPRTLQDNIVTAASVGPMGVPSSTARPSTVDVTLNSGELVKGTLISYDDFHVTLTDTAGHRRSFERRRGIPRVEIHNPVQAHLDMLREWEDADLHNLTAFLVKQK